MKKTSLILACMVAVGCTNTNAPVKQADDSQTAISITYPVTKKGDVVDTYFGQQVADPYRWLEDDLSEETGNWVKQQNKVTFDYLGQITYRDTIKDKLTKLWNYEKVGSPFKEGDYTYFYKNDGLQNQYVLYRSVEGQEPEVFLDPNKFSDDGTTSLATVSFSKNAKLTAYSISEGGSDWRKIIIIDTETKQPIEAPLVDVKFSGISWQGDEGFYYSSYDKPEGSELSAKTDQHKMYYHKIGTPQSQDTLVYGGTEAQKHRYVFGGVTDDDRYLVINAAKSTSGSKLLLKDLSNPDSELVTVLDHYDSDTSLVDNVGSKLLFQTNLNAPNKRLVSVDANNPGSNNWQDVIPETKNVLTVSTGSGYLFANYFVDAVSKVTQYNYDGKKVRDITLPGFGTARGFGGKKDADKLYFSFTNYNTPSTIYSLTPESGATDVYRKPKIAFDSEQFESKQVFYSSKDGTRVPMVITYKKGIKLNGKNPTILYGYGGFNYAMTPSFSTGVAGWLDMGGIFVAANIRGGGEYGKEWHKAGTQLQKQNVFDDFIAAGERLIADGYTSSDYLAVRGGSNGGLLVGAVMTQRPELFKVALPAVGVLDMLRYHTFTAGAGWAYDYGTANDNKEMFEYLKGYSPVHNVRSGVEYPATMVTTGDHDDRVVPAHSFKFAAELQDKQSGSNPTLIRIETSAGHGAGTPTSKVIDLYADMYAFTLFNMGFEKLPH